MRLFLEETFSLSWKRTLLFIVILAALSVFYYLKLYQKPSADQPAAFSVDAAQRYILELQNQEAIKTLSIHDPSKKTAILFERNFKSGWHIVSPVHFPAEPLIMDGFVTLLKLTPRLRHLSLNGLDGKDFGFDNPRLKICLSTSNRKDRCLLIGGDPVIGQGAYAKWEDETTYFLVEPVFLKSFDKTLYTVRRKQIFNLLDNEITSIRFESSKKEIHIVHQGKHWMFQKPVESIIGPQAMDLLLTELSSLYVKEFLDDEKSADLKPKFKKAVRTVRVLFRDGSEQVLIQGGQAGGRDAYYARLSEPETLFLVSQGKLNHLEEAFSKLSS